MVLTALLAVSSACSREDVQVYRVAKEQPMGAADSPTMPSSHPSTSSEGAAPPELVWTLPKGWQEAPPGEMRVASFRVQDGAKQAEMGVVPLPGLIGRDVESVNRWRSTVGLPAVTEEELPKMAQKIEIAGQQGDLYEQAGENPGSGEKSRILAAIMRRQNVAWFFKFTGDDELVAQQKPAFLEILKTLKFKESTGESDSGLPAAHPPIGEMNPLTQVSGNMPGSTQEKPTWKVPAGWKEASPGQFLVAKFTVDGANNEAAAVNVSKSAGAGGGVAGNINRWRGQLGLPELSDTEITSSTKPLEIPGGQAVTVEMSGVDARSGQKARLVGAIVPHGNETWFYKLMGSEQVVESQKAAFSTFVQTAKY